MNTHCTGDKINTMLSGYFVFARWGFQNDSEMRKYIRGHKERSDDTFKTYISDDKVSAVSARGSPALTRGHAATLGTKHWI